MRSIAMVMASCAAATPAWAQDAPPEPDGRPPPVAFHQPELRYPTSRLVKRTLVDVVAIPAGIPAWEADDWLVFSGFAGLTIGGMLPTNPSPDVRLDRWARQKLDPHVPDIWGMQMQVVFWSGLAVTGVGTWGVAWMADWPAVAEGMSLTVEALGVTQVYHLGFKMLIGREGPEDGDGLGLVRGPAASWSLFPAGTPGGHAATLYSVLGALEGYHAPPLAVSIGAHAVVGGLMGMHVINHRHFLSDAIWGGAMGYAIGRWVVRHRSSRFRYHQGRAIRVAVVPQLGPELQGLTLAVRW